MPVKSQDQRVLLREYPGFDCETKSVKNTKAVEWRLGDFFTMKGEPQPNEIFVQDIESDQNPTQMEAYQHQSDAKNFRFVSNSRQRLGGGNIKQGTRMAAKSRLSFSKFQTENSGRNRPQKRSKSSHRLHRIDLRKGIFAREFSPS